MILKRFNLFIIFVLNGIILIVMNQVYLKSVYRHPHQKYKQGYRKNKIKDKQYRIINPYANKYYKQASTTLSERKKSIQSIHEKIKEYFNMPQPQKDVIFQTSRQKNKINKCHSENNVLKCKKQQIKHQCKQYYTKPIHHNKQTIIHEYYPINYQMPIQKQKDLVLENKYSIAIRPTTQNRTTNLNKELIHNNSIRKLQDNYQQNQYQIVQKNQNRYQIRKNQQYQTNREINQNHRIYNNSQQRYIEPPQQRIVRVQQVTPITHVRHYHSSSPQIIKRTVISPFAQVQSTYHKNQLHTNRQSHSKQQNTHNIRNRNEQIQRIDQKYIQNNTYRNLNQIKQINQRNNINYDNQQNTFINKNHTNQQKYQPIVKNTQEQPYFPNKQCMYENFYQQYFENDYPFNMFEHNETKKEIKRKQISLQHFNKIMDDILQNDKSSRQLEEYVKELQQLKIDNIEQGKNYLHELQNFIRKYSPKDIKRNQYTFYYWDFLKQRDNEKMPKLMLTQKLMKKGNKETNQQKDKQIKQINKEEHKKKQPKIFNRKNMENSYTKSLGHSKYPSPKREQIVEQKQPNFSNYSRVIQYGKPFSTSNSQYIKGQISRPTFLINSQIHNNKGNNKHNKQMKMYFSNAQPFKNNRKKKIQMTLKRQN